MMKKSVVEKNKWESQKLLEDHPLSRINKRRCLRSLDKNIHFPPLVSQSLQSNKVLMENLLGLEVPTSQAWLHSYLRIQRSQSNLNACRRNSKRNPTSSGNL